MHTLNLFEEITQTVFIQSFGSSSSGNCTAIWDEHTTVLFDCGFSATYIRNALGRVKKNMHEVSAVFISHIHSDHVHHSAINYFLKHHIPIYCHEEVRPYFIKKYGHVFSTGYQSGINSFTHVGVKVRDIHVRPFAVPHDSEGGCFGFTIAKKWEGGEKKITIATDLVRTGNKLLPFFTNADFILLESNYDPHMLTHSGRPAYLINRIRENGHLSNEACAQFLVEILSHSTKQPKKVMLGHISKDCNTNAKALACSREHLIRNNFGHIPLIESYRNMESEIVEI